MSRICLTDEADTVSKQKGGLAEIFLFHSTISSRRNNKHIPETALIYNRD